jgi:LuxR family transcriptional regulator, maltose regulon positive regulatory protein
VAVQLARATLETLVIGGVANFRLAATEVAADMLDRAVNQVHRLGSLLPFVRVPRQDLGALAALVPSLERLLQEEPLASTPDIYPVTVDVATLTEREMVILEGIAAGRSLRRSQR